MGGGGGGGGEGDCECYGCRNRNYAFRSFCTRCKQPRLLVDTKTPSDSKWLPRIGDWICTACVFSMAAIGVGVYTTDQWVTPATIMRVNCKKCGQPKEVTAMPGASDPTPRIQVVEQILGAKLGEIMQLLRQ